MVSALRLLMLLARAGLGRLRLVIEGERFIPSEPLPVAFRHFCSFSMVFSADSRLSPDTASLHTREDCQHAAQYRA